MSLYRTKELHIAAFLQEEGYELVNTERDNGKVTFVFHDPNESANGHVFSFLNGAKVSAVSYHDKLRHLKTVVMRGVGA